MSTQNSGCGGRQAELSASRTDGGQRDTGRYAGRASENRTAGEQRDTGPKASRANESRTAGGQQNTGPKAGRRQGKQEKRAAMSGVKLFFCLSGRDCFALISRQQFRLFRRYHAKAVGSFVAGCRICRGIFLPQCRGAV